MPTEPRLSPKDRRAVLAALSRDRLSEIDDRGNEVIKVLDPGKAR